MIGGSPTDNLTPEEIQQLVDALKQFGEQLRQRMERLMNGEPLSHEELEALGQMVGLNNTYDLRYQNWITRRRMSAHWLFPKSRKQCVN